MLTTIKQLPYYYGTNSLPKYETYFEFQTLVGITIYVIAMVILVGLLIKFLFLSKDEPEKQNQDQKETEIIHFKNEKTNILHFDQVA